MQPYSVAHTASCLGLRVDPVHIYIAARPLAQAVGRAEKPSEADLRSDIPVVFLRRLPRSVTRQHINDMMKDFGTVSYRGAP